MVANSKSSRRSPNTRVFLGRQGSGGLREITSRSPGVLMFGVAPVACSIVFALANGKRVWVSKGWEMLIDNWLPISRDDLSNLDYLDQITLEGGVCAQKILAPMRLR
ncbi:hypothetical protein BDQ94DRAFT_164548 [Aspergillus welwitschiae]|uniref:Uncharacterized protein n=1 Tax=Aspergillus welwitschiae TaxID=1341132 RepID=A0A3F3PHD1_9EURO|nr:hypothetical protein BDQ94DRAFT_164548 [Aspergillus welwitschiae]RDH26365.1 hypothetical protein BDQ94DRAFT_164548 [Aspergillus welwitschiae]